MPTLELRVAVVELKMMAWVKLVHWPLRVLQVLQLVPATAVVLLMMQVGSGLGLGLLPAVTNQVLKRLAVIPIQGELRLAVMLAVVPVRLSVVPLRLAVVALRLAVVPQRQAQVLLFLAVMPPMLALPALRLAGAVRSAVVHLQMAVPVHVLAVLR